MPMRRVRADVGINAMSAAHSAPAGIATGSPSPRHAPALLAQYNAAARAIVRLYRGIVADQNLTFRASNYASNTVATNSSKLSATDLVVINFSASSF